MSPEDRIAEYRIRIAEALVANGPNVHLVEAYAACISTAVYLLSMATPQARQELCSVVEKHFRKDVEDCAMDPGAKSGVATLQ